MGGSTKASQPGCCGSSSAGPTSPKLSGVAGSTRSSGRSSGEPGDQAGVRYASDEHPSGHQLRRADSLQRSRSNSSSGLGSISIGASSPDQNGRSSPSQHSFGSETDLAGGPPPPPPPPGLGLRHQPSRAPDGSLLQAKLVNDEFIMFGSSLVEARLANAAASRPPGTSEAAPGGQAKRARAKGEATVAAEPSPSSSPSSPPVKPLNSSSGGGGGNGTSETANGKPPTVAGHLRNGRVEVPLKINNDRRNGNTYLATKQIIY